MYLLVMGMDLILVNRHLKPLRHHRSMVVKRWQSSQIVWSSFSSAASAQSQLLLCLGSPHGLDESLIQCIHFRHLIVQPHSGVLPHFGFILVYCPILVSHEAIAFQSLNKNVGLELYPIYPSILLLLNESLFSHTYLRIELGSAHGKSGLKFS